MTVADPAEAGAEPVIVDRHEDLTILRQSIEESLEFVAVVALDPDRHRRSETPGMIDGAVGAAEFTVGETESGDPNNCRRSCCPRCGS